MIKVLPIHDTTDEHASDLDKSLLAGSGQCKHLRLRAKGVSFLEGGGGGGGGGV